MKVFEHFSEGKECPICQTGEDKPCVLIPLDGTEDGNICEAVIFHKECVDNLDFRYSEEMGIIYHKLP